MSDFLLAIWADRNTCKPYTGAGRVGHVVQVTSNPHPTIINEFTDGGSFEHEDCGPASLQSWLLDATPTRTTIPEIEQLAGTNLNGTGFAGLIVAAEHFGYQVKFVPDPPLPGYIMNPGGGFIDDISTFSEYLAASQGGCLVLPNLAPIPQPPKPEEITDPMHLFAIQGLTGAEAGAVYLFVESGTYFHVGTSEDENSFKASGATGPVPLTAETHAVMVALYPPHA